VVLVAGMSSDHRLSLKALEELCRLCPYGGFQIRSEGGSEFDNKTRIPESGVNRGLQ